MNHRITIRLQNSRPNIRPADHTRLITNTAKSENQNIPYSGHKKAAATSIQ